MPNTYAAGLPGMSSSIHILLSFIRKELSDCLAKTWKSSIFKQNVPRFLLRSGQKWNGNKQVWTLSKIPVNKRVNCTHKNSDICKMYSLWLVPRVWFGGSDVCLWEPQWHSNYTQQTAPATMLQSRTPQLSVGSPPPRCSSVFPLPKDDLPYKLPPEWVECRTISGE